MHLHHTDIVPEESASSPQSRTDSRMGWLVLSKGIWIAVVVAVLIVFVASIPPYFTSLHMAGPPDQGVNGDQQLTSAGLQQLHALGLSADFYAAYFVAIFAFFVAVWLVVGVLIFWRKADDRMAYFGSLILAIFPVNFIVGNMVDSLPASWWLPVQSVRFFGGMGLALFFYIFPDGRFVPRWTRWLLIGWVIHELFGDTIFAYATFNPFLHLTWLDALLFISLLLTLVGTQIYRYRRVSNAVQRQQTKWVVFGMTIAVLGFAATLTIGSVSMGIDMTSMPIVNMITNTMLMAFLILIPISIGFAISRSHLWDIDIIINRALVYGSLTGILGALYAGLVIGLESLVRTITGQSADQPIVLVISTLIIAALFQPARKRIQLIIDHRFYRKKYDARKTLAAFNATLRDEVDLGQLQESLLAVVEETMQPAHVSLWVCSSAWTKPSSLVTDE